MINPTRGFKMANWQVEFEIDYSTTITEAVECHFAHNAPKVAIKQMDEGSAKLATAHCTKITVNPV